MTARPDFDTAPSHLAIEQGGELFRRVARPTPAGSRRHWPSRAARGYSAPAPGTNSERVASQLTTTFRSLSPVLSGHSDRLAAIRALQFGICEVTFPYVFLWIRVSFARPLFMSAINHFRRLLCLERLGWTFNNYHWAGLIFFRCRDLAVTLGQNK